MMRAKHWILLSLASLVLVGYVSKTAINQAAENSLTVMPSSATPSTSSSTIAQGMGSAKAKVLKSGKFVSGEHPTQGTARIVTENGKMFLELDQSFKTSDMGPDLVVLLHRSGDVIGSTKPPAYPLKSGDYVILASLQKFNGAQRYAIPANVNLANYQSAAIWCRKFNATFGVAKLSS